MTFKKAVSFDLTRYPTLLVKVDNAAVSLAPGTHIHSSTLGDVRLAGVGFRSTNQNIHTRQQKGINNLRFFFSIGSQSNITHTKP